MALKQIDKVKTRAHLTKDVTELERQNHEVARLAARESIVLLENDGVLPLNADRPVALFGTGATNTVKGGSGSGEVKNRASVSIYEGMKAAGYTITSAAMLERYFAYANADKAAFFARMQKEAGLLNTKVSMASMEKPYIWPAFYPLNESELKEDAASGTDVCIYVISRISGEGYDRKLEKGDYYLTDEEEANIRACARAYRKLIIVINAGGLVELSAIEDVKRAALIFVGMPGCAGGEAFADVLSGAVSPSGKLAATWPKHYTDIPNGMEYSFLNGNVDKEYYTEGLYVGYRYFDSFDVEPAYAFGFGLSYTSFAISSELRQVSGTDELTVRATVHNTGSCAGKEVVQIYVSCPDGKLERERKVLVAFRKTRELAAGESETLDLCFRLLDLAGYDEQSASYLLEKGEYLIFAGNAADHVSPVASVLLDAAVTISRNTNICPLQESLEQLHKPAWTRPSFDGLPQVLIPAQSIKTEVIRYETPDTYHDRKTDELLSRLSTAELVDVVVGVGLDMVMPMKHFYNVPGATGYSTNKFIQKGIKDIAFCDGPAGLRFQQESVVLKGKNKVKAITSSIDTLEFLPSLIRKLGFGKPSDGTPVYQYATAFPTGTMLAQTWNTDMVEAVGQAANLELEEYGVTFWLAPGMNLQRNVLCGRNYEYYSEDPLLTGKIAAAMVRGIQSAGNHSATLKHFCCNNQETNRGAMSAVVSERVLRELYLKGFEIAVKEGHASGVMTSYNRVNGVFSAVSKDLLTKVLRNEWGFTGLTMTDWDSAKDGYSGDAAVAAGLDIQMPGEGKLKKQIRSGLRAGTVTEEELRRAAANVLRRISMID